MIAELFPGPVVDLFLYLMHLVAGQIAKISPLRQVLSDQAVDILYAWFLLWAGWVTEVSFDTVLVFDLGVFGILGAVVESDTFNKVSWQGFDCLSQSLVGFGRLEALKRC